MIKSDKYGTMIDYRVAVLMYRCPDSRCNGYHYSVTGLYLPNDETLEPSWVETDINGVEETRELAFEAACMRFDSSNN